MDFLRPESLAEALALRREHPGGWPVSGGTVVMPKLHLEGARPAALLDLSRVPELRVCRSGDRELRVGASTTYQHLVSAAPGSGLSMLAAAARGVGTPQVRRRGTLGGGLAAAQPAGDIHPVLLAAEAVIEVADADGSRDIPARRFYGTDGTTALRPDELIVAVRMRPPAVPVYYRKVRVAGARGPAVCSLALVLDPYRRIAGVAVGGMRTPPSAVATAERLLTEQKFGVADPFDGPLDSDFVEAFAEAVGQAAGAKEGEPAPSDEQGVPIAYRRHALRVLAARALAACWNDVTGRTSAGDADHKR